MILDLSWPTASSTTPVIDYEIVNVADWPPDEALQLGHAKGTEFKAR